MSTRKPSSGTHGLVIAFLCFYLRWRRVRWKQRDIHEKCDARNRRIDEVGAEIACNLVLLERLKAFAPQVAESGSSRFSAEVERLHTSPSPDAPPTNAPNPVSYDTILDDPAAA
ncbi:hypothetical protein FA95DRAFT_986633 [Auriscalpium vulgare]|uniref:Uncharacterized protein n=1 Tax=Auriscalpium vulgare TaxID=40419 RepID=A0ACB8RXV3_9AGAM|nr:hypothetical protein FA95DRAFT_986633 [Auriscalpium vulgare]